MKTSALASRILLLALLLLASPAFAQYIYLDSNGDGVHTSADVLHGIGPTVVDIWLDIGHNRDGTPTACNVPGQPLSMFGYEVTLQASGGTLSWSAYTNRVTQMAFIGLPQAPDETHFVAGDFFTPPGAILPPGKYHLGTLTVNVASGTPRLDFVGVTSWGAPIETYTMFSGPCDATTYANAFMLSVDWFDQDGLAFEAGGMANGPPSLASVANPTVPSGENVTVPLTATDGDGQALTFAKGSGPAYMTVSTTDPGAGVARGELHLAPFASDAGTASGSVSVTDGTASDSKAFTITVTASPGHPPVLFAVPGLTVIAGRVGTRSLSGGDPDGGSPHFRKASGPGYASVQELVSRPGGASALLRVAPGLCDVGTTTARVAVSDGISEAQEDVALKIIPPTNLPDAQVHYSSNPGSGFGIKLADMNADGHLDAVVTYEGNDGRVSVLRGIGDGRFGPAASYPIASSALRLAVADLDGNGTPDVATANTFAGSLSVLLNRGDGTLSPAVAYRVVAGTQDVAVADFNRDGIPDLVASGQAANAVSVLLGVGNGTFLPARNSAAGQSPVFVVTADFNLDGRMDVAVGNQLPGSNHLIASVLPGLGDGSFGDPISISSAARAFPLSLTTDDWNRDGLPDLVIVDGDGPVLFLAGHGDGTFAASMTVARLDFPFTSAAGDLDGDGNPDLAVGVVGQGGVVALLGNGSGSFGVPIPHDGIGPTVALGDVNSDGRPDFASAWFVSVGVRFNRLGPANPAVARAFVPNDNRPVPAGGNSDFGILVESVGGTFTSDLLDFSSFTLSSEGTGSVGQIHSISARRTVDSDRDGNGVPEVTVTFSRADLANLFDQLHGRVTVTADLAGSLTDGRAFCNDVSFTIMGKAHSALTAASFSPNPLNPSSKLTFATEREGSARVMIFDLHGRLVRKLLDNPRLSAGPHEIVFDGKTDRGAALSSGVYFYRVESTSGRNEGQIVILK